MRNAPIVPALAIALLVSISACEPDDVTDVSAVAEPLEGEDLEAINMEGDRAGFTSLAVVVAPGGAVVEFGRLEAGGITVSELVRAGELSPMNALMTGQRATPLELFLAIAPDDRTVPLELEEAHVTYAAANQLDPSPRALSLSLDASLRRLNHKSEYSWKYAADCDLPDDGGWFDCFWQTFDWNWHWYWRTNAYSGWSPTTPKRVAVQSHLCNDGPSGDKIHRVSRSSCGSFGGWDYVFTATVPPEYRSQFRVWDAPIACYYETRNSNPIGSSRYPTYSYGITTP